MEPRRPRMAKGIAHHIVDSWLAYCQMTGCHILMSPQVLWLLKVKLRRVAERGKARFYDPSLEITDEHMVVATTFFDGWVREATQFDPDLELGDGAKINFWMWSARIYAVENSVLMAASVTDQTASYH